MPLLFMLTQDEVGHHVLEKMFTTTRWGMNEAQLHSYEHFVRVVLPKSIETSRQAQFESPDKSELHFFTLSTTVADRPTHKESTGVSPPISTDDCRIRDLTYSSPFRNTLTITVFTKNDPNTEQVRGKLISDLQQSMLRPTAGNNNNGGNAKKPRKTGTVDYTDFQLPFDCARPDYVDKTQQAMRHCMLTPGQRENYPYLARITIYQDNVLIDVPTMVGSSLDHGGVDDQFELGAFVVSGKTKVFNLHYYSAFSRNFIVDNKKDNTRKVLATVENRSAHTTVLRTSSSTLQVQLIQDDEGGRHLVWVLPHLPKLKVPWYVLFSGLGMLDKQAVIDVTRSTILHYLNNDVNVSSSALKKMLDVVQASFHYHMDGSETLTTREDVCAYVGRTVSKAKKVKNDDVLQQWEDQETSNKALPTEEQQKKEQFRDGHAYLVKEVVPHSGSEYKETRDQDMSKIVALAEMTAHVLMSVYMKKHCKAVGLDRWANRRIRCIGEELTPLFRGVFKNQIKKAATTWKSSLFHDTPFNPRSSLDPKRSNKIVSTAFAMGIFQCPVFPTGNGGGAPMKVRRSNTAAHNAAGGRDKTGMNQPHNHTNLNSIWYQPSKVQANLQNTGIDSSAREIFDDYGVMDFMETPDNKQCGTVKPMAICTRLSLQPVDVQFFEDLLLEKFFIHPLIEGRPLGEKTTAIKINGKTLGWTTVQDGRALATFCKFNRYELLGEAFLSVTTSSQINAVDLWCDAGRTCRPLFVASKLKEFLGPTIASDPTPLCQRLTWTNMLQERFIEMIDKHEESHDLYIAFALDQCGPDHTHCEISGTVVQGPNIAQIPFSNHSQATRNCYMGNISKQAESNMFLSSAKRFDPMSHHLTMSTKRLVYTPLLIWNRCEDVSNGFMINLAILCFYGYNIEDAILQNQDSMDRGVGGSIQSATHCTTEKRSTAVERVEVFRRADPDDTLAIKFNSYAAIDPSDGLPFPGSYISPGDVIVGKCASITTPNNEFNFQDLSVLAQKASGLVESTILTSDGKGQRVVKVRCERTFGLNVGDKVSTSHAGKCIVGQIIAEADMPYFADGTMPDMVLNPHSVVSRMACAHLLETLGGTLACSVGERMNGSGLTQLWRKICDDIEEDTDALQKLDPNVEGYVDWQKWAQEGGKDGYSVAEEMSRALVRRGLNPTGERECYNRQTGEKMGYSNNFSRNSGVVFSGPTFMHRLYHHSSDKIHARSVGITNVLLRCPTKGSSKGGSYSTSEMEKICIQVFEAANLLKERTLDVSDAFISRLCSRCGLTSRVDLKNKKYRCNVCDNDQSVVEVELPFSFTYLVKTILTSQMLLTYKVGA